MDLCDTRDLSRAACARVPLPVILSIHNTCHTTAQSCFVCLNTEGKGNLRSRVMSYYIESCATAAVLLISTY